MNDKKGEGTAMDNLTLMIDPKTQDLIFDETGSFIKTYENNTVIQNIRHVLLTWKNEFFADTTHGTAYEQIYGINQNGIDNDEVNEIIRDAVFQEPKVSRIDSLEISYDKRTITIMLSLTLVDGENVNLEVTA